MYLLHCLWLLPCLHALATSAQQESNSKVTVVLLFLLPPLPCCAAAVSFAINVTTAHPVYDRCNGM